MNTTPHIDVNYLHMFSLIFVSLASYHFIVRMVVGVNKNKNKTRSSLRSLFCFYRNVDLVTGLSKEIYIPNNNLLIN